MIIARDEEQRLERCVRSCLPFSDEVLVVDGGSTDGTIALAERLGCRVVESPWPGYGAQRNIGAQAAAHDWIFSIDCDEAVDDELAAALGDLGRDPEPSAGAVSVRRVNSFLGAWLTESPELKVRLYDRRRAAFTERDVHELVDVAVDVTSTLPGAVWHANAEDFEDATRRLNLYTTLEADIAARERPMRIWRVFVRPLLRLGQRAVLQRSLRHGWRGLFLALHWAYWELLREMKVYERRHPVSPATGERPLRILFVNHTGHSSGAENAMLRLLEGLPAEHARAVACPSDGGLAAAVRGRGVEHFDFPGTELSFALDPVQTPLALGRLVRSALSLVRTARSFGADVIHANSTRAGLIAGLARTLGGPPVVVQCHDHLPHGRRGALTRRAIAASSRVVVGVTDATANRFNEGLRGPKATRVYISIDHERFSATVRGDSRVRDELGLPEHVQLLIHIAQITPWKGQDTSIRALAEARRSSDLDVHLLVVGEVAFESRRYDNEGFHRTLRDLSRDLGLEDRVHFLGHRVDAPELMGAADLLLLPSWDEPFGLVVAEALACGTPVLVTDEGGVGEYVSDGDVGRLLPPGDPAAWGRAVVDLLADEQGRAAMSRAGVARASEFTDERYAAGMLEAYRRAARR